MHDVPLVDARDDGRHLHRQDEESIGIERPPRELGGQVVSPGVLEDQRRMTAPILESQRLDHTRRIDVLQDPMFMAQQCSRRFVHWILLALDDHAATVAPLATHVVSTAFSGEA
jgi:hypothetical protein